MPKGQKICGNPNCLAVVGPRTFVCKSCGFVFPIKRREKVTITPNDIGNLNEVLGITENTPVEGVDSVTV